MKHLNGQIDLKACQLERIIANACLVDLPPALILTHARRRWRRASFARTPATWCHLLSNDRLRFPACRL